MKQIALSSLVVAAGLVLSPAVWAGAGVGAGVTWKFGGPKAQSGPAVGLKVFSTDREKKGALSLGVDYSFVDRSVRPNVGLAYLSKHDAYVDANIGYNFKEQSPDFGIGAGYVNTKRR